MNKTLKLTHGYEDENGVIIKEIVFKKNFIPFTMFNVNDAIESRTNPNVIFDKCAKFLTGLKDVELNSLSYQDGSDLIVFITENYLGDSEGK